MAINLKELATQPELFTGGHRACAGCTAPSVIRMILKVSGPHTVVSFATGCMEVVTTIYPYTAWKVPYIHNAFENSAATMSGVEAAYQALKKQGKIDKKINFIAFGGDGGTYDIGLQSLSGVMERGHDLLYVCYDNEGYMNTGIQRSGATPLGAHTNTSPAGTAKQGKEQNKKDLTAIMVAHHVPYVAQAIPGKHMDLMKKAEKALAIEGAKFLNVLAPCHRGWRCEIESTMELSRIAVETCFWPLFEVENGVYTINYKPKEKLPLTEYIFRQRRFEHLKKDKNKHLLEAFQAEVDRRWEQLLMLEKATQAQAQANAATS